MFLALRAGNQTGGSSPLPQDFLFRLVMVRFHVVEYGMQVILSDPSCPASFTR